MCIPAMCRDPCEPLAGDESRHPISLIPTGPPITSHLPPGLAGPSLAWVAQIIICLLPSRVLARYFFPQVKCSPGIYTDTLPPRSLSMPVRQAFLSDHSWSTPLRHAVKHYTSGLFNTNSNRTSEPVGLPHHAIPM